MTAQRPDTREREFVIGRRFAVPRERLFQAWTEPAQLAQWWGPHGFSSPCCELDVRPGGRYRIVMRGPDGSEYVVSGVYREVQAPRRLVLTDDCSGHPQDWSGRLDPRPENGAPASLDALSTVTFDLVGGGTLLGIRTLFASVAIRDAMLKLGMAEGWGESLERLERHLAGA
ncbi:MAG TPA: SRPBCC domain-containing protein [Pseudomonas sp.]|nr:SRPBCC domain-containing protein [Pseudomonas sp.]